MWEFQPGYEGEAPPIGQTLNMSILVPFPVESCLSGIGLNYQVGVYMKHGPNSSASCMC
jgi:hypothetical protein